MLKTFYLIEYLIFMIAAFIAALTKNPYLLAFDCTIILAIVLNKGNYEEE